MQFKPQPGPQTEYFLNPSDLIIYGGSAGGGKSYALLLDPLRRIHIPGFTSVIFRRTYPEIENVGGLWDDSETIYPFLGGVPKESDLRWDFPKYNNSIKFAHMEYEKDKFKYQGSQICFMGFDELTHFCLIPETEVLTKKGWKSINSISTFDKVASINQNRKIEYKRVLETHSYNFDGDLICVNQKLGVSFKATPNHEMIIQRQDLNKSLGKKRLDEWGHDSIIRVGNWNGSRRKYKTFKPPKGRGHGINSNSILKIPMDVYLKFLGWYLAEGCCFEHNNRTSSPQISIRQTTEGHKQELRDLFNSLGYRWKETKDGQFNIFSRQLFKELSKLGNTYTKRVPRWVFNLSKKQINIFLEAFKKGDGYEINGAIHYGLANKGLRDDLQELYFLTGRISTAGYQKTKTGFDVYRLNVSKQSRFKTQVKNEDLYKEKYQGPVYCLTVEDNHNFLIRYNGRICFSGNSQSQFFYLLSRNRSTCGIRPYIRATCNPDSESWVAEFLAYWIDQDTGYPIPERSGVIRYFVRDRDAIIWADSEAELREMVPYIPDEDFFPKSVSFIPAKLSDNPALLQKDPGYRANLLALSFVDRERLLGGNWKIKPSAGNMFRPEWFQFIDLDDLPTQPGNMERVRSWDAAATEPETKNKNPDYTAGVLMAEFEGRYYILDLQHFQRSPAQTTASLKSTAEMDGREIDIYFEQEGGSAAKREIDSFKTGLFKGYKFQGKTVGKRDKIIRAKPFSAAVENGLVSIVRGPWNAQYVNELSQFPDPKFHDDIVDASSAGFEYLNRRGLRGKIDLSKVVKQRTGIVIPKRII